MYEEFYRLKAEPFRLSPDHKFCFGHKGFQKARAYLAYAFRRAEGFVMITGQPGTGKTTLIGDLVDTLAVENVVTANLVCTQLKADDLLRLVAYTFGIDTSVENKAELLRRLQELLHAWHRDGRRALLIVDEAQDLSECAVEELRLLTNIQIDGRPLLQIFLLGQPELRELILAPGMVQVHQRIVAASHLDGLKEDETAAYILHRLEIVGWRGDPAISKAVYPLIYKFSEGIPRRINLICSRLLLLGSVEQKHEIGVAELREVVEELQSENLSAGACFSDEDFDVEDEFEALPEPEPEPEISLVPPVDGAGAGEATSVQPQPEDSDARTADEQAEPGQGRHKSAVILLDEKRMGSAPPRPDLPVQPVGGAAAAVAGAPEPVPEVRHPEVVAVRDSAPAEVTPPDDIALPEDLRRQPSNSAPRRAASRRSKSKTGLWWLLAILIAGGVGMLALVYREDLPAPLNTLVAGVQDFVSGNRLSDFEDEARQPMELQPESTEFSEEVGAGPANTPAGNDLADAEVASSLFEPQNAEALPADAVSLDDRSVAGAAAEDTLRDPDTSVQPSALESDKDLPGSDLSNSSPVEQAGALASTAETNDAETTADVPEPDATVEQPSAAVFRIDFDFDSTILSPDAMSRLDRVAEVLKSQGTSTAVVTGYADKWGQSEYNMQLSVWRAQSVASYLIDAGVARGRLRVEGRGVYLTQTGELTGGTAGGESQRFVEIVVSMPSS